MNWEVGAIDGTAKNTWKLWGKHNLKHPETTFSIFFGNPTKIIPKLSLNSSNQIIFSADFHQNFNLLKEDIPY